MRVGGGRGVFGIGLISSPMTLPLLAPYLGKHHQPDRSIALPPAPEHALPPSLLPPVCFPQLHWRKPIFAKAPLGLRAVGGLGLGSKV